MKTSGLFSLKSSLTAIALGMSTCLASLQAEVIRYAAQPGSSKIQVEGTSTLHPWIVQSQLIGGFMELDASFAKDPAFKAEPGLKLTPKAEAIILVRTIKSDKAKMDEVMHEAMKQKEHPRITYRLTEMVLKTVPKSPEDPYEFDTKGELTVAGVKKALEMPVTLQRVGADKIKAAGKTDLKMTEFGIKPPAPVLLLGLVKTGDDVKVTFEWVIAESKKPAPASASAQ